MLEWEQWIKTFIYTYRNEANQLSREHKSFFGEHIDEQCLLQPCQVEVLEFDSPYRLVLLFILKTEPDLKVTFRKTNWRNINAVVEQLTHKYELPDDLFTMLRDFRDLRTTELNFAVDAFKHVMAVCFPNDIRSWTPTNLRRSERLNSERRCRNGIPCELLPSPGSVLSSSLQKGRRSFSYLLCESPLRSCPSLMGDCFSRGVSGGAFSC